MKEWKELAAVYKRKIQLWTLGIAFVLTLATNSSSILIIERLWNDDSLRTSIAKEGQERFKKANVNQNSKKGDVTETQGRDAFELLKSFPIGWEQDLPQGCLGWLKRLLGWIMTTAAVSLGAPFWFDLLGKVANLRGSGGNKSGISK